MTTKTLQSAMFRHKQKMGVYSCLEVKMPDSTERVDMLTYVKRNNTWEMYEFKVSKEDLYSKAALTFRGHRNFLCVPEELADEALLVAPSGVGVYSVKDYGDIALATSIRASRKQKCELRHDDLMFSMMQALAGKYQRSHLYMGEEFLDERVVELKQEIKDLKDKIKTHEFQEKGYLSNHRNMQRVFGRIYYNISYDYPLSSEFLEDIEKENNRLLENAKQTIGKGIAR